jgi:hypothetical protein
MLIAALTALALAGHVASAAAGDSPGNGVIVIDLNNPEVCRRLKAIIPTLNCNDQLGTGASVSAGTTGATRTNGVSLTVTGNTSPNSTSVTTPGGTFTGSGGGGQTNPGAVPVAALEATSIIDALVSYVTSAGLGAVPGTDPVLDPLMAAILNANGSSIPLIKVVGSLDATSPKPGSTATTATLLGANVAVVPDTGPAASSVAAADGTLASAGSAEAGLNASATLGDSNLASVSVGGTSVTVGGEGCGVSTSGVTGGGGAGVLGDSGLSIVGGGISVGGVGLGDAGGLAVGSLVH